MLQNIHLKIFKGISPLLELMVIEKVAKEMFLPYPSFLLLLMGKALVCSFRELIGIFYNSLGAIQGYCTSPTYQMRKSGPRQAKA